MRGSACDHTQHGTRAPVAEIARGELEAREVELQTNAGIACAAEQRRRAEKQRERAS
jgi:hypothetical protein